MPETSDKPAAVFGAAIASFILAGALGIAAFFLLWGLFDTVDVMTNGGRRAPRGGASLGILGLVGILLALGSLVFAFIGVKTMWDGARNIGKKKTDDEHDDDYWKSFPAPKG